MKRPIRPRFTSVITVIKDWQGDANIQVPGFEEFSGSESGRNFDKYAREKLARYL